MAATDVLYVGSDNLISVENLRLTSTGGYLTTATVTLTKIEDSTGATVSGSTGITLSYYGTNGVYHGTLPDSVSLTENAEYTAVITAVYSNLTKTWRRTLRARYANQGE
jgi:hypothetical protein